MTAVATDQIEAVLGPARDAKLPSLTREELIALGDTPMLATVGRPLLRAIEVLLPRQPPVRAEVEDRRALLAAAHGTWHLAELDAQGATHLRRWLSDTIFGESATPVSSPEPGGGS